VDEGGERLPLSWAVGVGATSAGLLLASRWVVGPSHFEGVALSSLLASGGAALAILLACCIVRDSKPGDLPADVVVWTVLLALGLATARVLVDVVGEDRIDWRERTSALLGCVGFGVVLSGFFALARMRRPRKPRAR
jgi:hypothetical protein